MEPKFVNRGKETEESAPSAPFGAWYLEDVEQAENRQPSLASGTSKAKDMADEFPWW